MDDKTCKTCRFWQSNWHGVENGRCDRVDCVNPPELQFDIGVEVSDDTGLWTWLTTGPDFGCVLHQAKTLIVLAALLATITAAGCKSTVQFTLHHDTPYGVAAASYVASN